jgi:uncharacterized protein YciI
MNYYALEYEGADDYVNRRAPHREAHLRLVRAAHARGEVALAGGVGEPPQGALLIFKGESPRAAEQFAKDDPYVTQGVVKSWRVRPWNVVVGGKDE